VAAQNLDILGLRQVELLPGEFDSTLLPALQALRQVDFFYFDGNHRPEPTLRYFETCLPFASAKAAFVFDDVHWSAEMEQAWKSIQQHPRVTLTVDFFDFSVAFINPDFREKQQIAVVPARWKIWRFW
jgi:predicted O-methyltransferase YrrM